MAGTVPERGANPSVSRDRGFPGEWASKGLVFSTSAAVLMLEILAGRLVAPYVGVSLETYTAIIGTVLAGIAIGSAAGGRLADRMDPRAAIGPLLVASGLTSLLIPPVIALVGPDAASRGGGATGTILLALVAFVAPTALLSAVSPMVAKLRVRSTAETGTIVGGLSAAGTAGALFGTFATGFVFVSAFPTRPLIVVLGAVLALAGMAISFAGRRPPSMAVVALLLVGSGIAAVSPSPCERESIYYCVSVERDPDRPTGRFLVLDDLNHSYVDLEDPTYLEFRYTKLFAAVVDATVGSGRVDALHIGGGGFTFPRWLDATRPGTTNTVLELDEALVEIAESDLGLRRGRRLSVYTGDARRTITRQPKGGFDLVIGDAFGGASVPWHLATTEMVEHIARTMRPDAVYLLNVIDGGPQDLARAMLATLSESFRHVALIAPPDGPYGNHVLVASDAPIRLPSVDATEGVEIVGSALEEFVGGASPLRDDFAPTDQLITR